jgi:hypothetical protein
VATRDLPPRVIRFPHLQRRGRPTSARHARSDRRHGTGGRPCPAPSRPGAWRRCACRSWYVVGAATLRGRQSPHPLRVSWGPPSGYPWESFGTDLALRHAHCHDTWHARPEGEEWRRPDPEGERPLAPLIAATLARGGWLDPLRARRDLHPVRSTKLAWRANGLRYLLVGGRGQCLRCRKSPKPEKCL